MVVGQFLAHSATGEGFVIFVSFADLRLRALCMTFTKYDIGLYANQFQPRFRQFYSTRKTNILSN